ncbi:hypothetical protein H0H87_007780 [Tephrocybe sp. NHM501043]|nr:hypothetical protein H0H87_007780 [Tephrocybe sp. NHM501043]
MSKRRVAYYYDADAGAYTYGLGHPMKPHRIRVTHDLVTAYDMLPKMHVLRPKRATPETMSSFHTDEYIHFLNRVTPETAEDLTYHGTRCAAKRITSGAADIAINWAGGLHHAKKREASGFCYINDIVLGILELLRTYPRVLYIDIDCHHGDGVEEAFYTTDRVMTCSFHKFGEYFPGTGTQDDRGRGKGKGYAINVPLKDGITDQSFQSVFEPVIMKILEVFQPSAVVLQCGADSLAGDKLGCFNLTMHGHAHCVQFLRKQNIPLILLGGGGYTVKNVARTWTYETACALGIEDTIDPLLPWNEYFEWFGPRYRLEVVENNMEDLNVKDGSLDTVRITALEHLSELIPAPSVGMHDVPRESVSHHLGLDDDEPRDDLDERLARKFVVYSLNASSNICIEHMRYAYDLQESDSPSETSDDDSWDSDESLSSRRSRTRRFQKSSTQSRTHMSLLTGQYFDVPVQEQGYSHFEHGAVPGKTAKRRFFQSAASWDETIEDVIIGKLSPFPIQIGELMERGGRPPGVEEGEEEWEDMAVDP